MIVRGLDANGDWLYGKGKSDYRSKGDAVLQNLKTRLLQFLGDCFFDQTAGIDWFGLMGTDNVAGLKLAISTVILNTPEVTGLIELSVVLDENRRITISYSVTTIYTGVASDDEVVANKITLLLTQGGSFITTEDGNVLQA